MDATYLSLVSFAGIASAIGALLFGLRDLFSKSREESRLRQELRRLPKLGAPEGTIAKFDHWFAQTLYLSGLKMGAIEGILLITLACLAVGGAVFVATENELFTVVASLLAMAITLVTISIVAHRRLKKFGEQFPAAMDLLARAVRAGESLEQAMSLVAETTQDPVGPEFQRCAKQLQMGLALPACMKALSQRIPLMDVRIFCNALAVHRQAGGNLSVTLERLAEVIRDRMAYHRQLRSVTAGGRFSAMLISIVGPLLFVYLFVFQPQYGGKLLEDPMGQVMLAGAVVCQIIGFLWVTYLIRKDY